LVDLLTQIQESRRVLIQQLIDSQQSDGGWATDERSDRGMAPRAGGNAATTAIVLRALAGAGYRAGLPVMDRAIGLLRRQQKPNGRWDRPSAASSMDATTTVATSLGSTANALAALIEAGSTAKDKTCHAAIHWLTAHEQPGGGWGERDRLASKHLAGEGPRSMVTTAVVVEGLLAAGCGHLDAVSRGVDYLLQAETPDDRADVTVLNAICRWARDENNKDRDRRQPKAPSLRVAAPEPATA
jgi:squalene-hopene/tetraprenyl-beta-curcumene cyclase